MEKQIIKILQEVSYNIEDQAGDRDIVVSQRDFEEIAVKITKLLESYVDEIIARLGEPTPDNKYLLVTDKGEWWIEHAEVGSGEPLKQFLLDR